MDYFIFYLFRGIKGTIMKSKLSLFFIITALFISFTSLAWSKSLFNTVSGLPELLQKLATAKVEHKPVMLEFWASWCPSCQLLDNNIFSDTSVQRNMQSLVAIRINLTDKLASQMEIAEYFQVYGTPTIMLFDHTGKEVNKGRFSVGISVESLNEAIRAL